LVHEVLREMSGGDDRDVFPLGAAIEDLLGGPRGTLADLADRFTQARLGAIMASWITTARTSRSGRTNSPACWGPSACATSRP
jgi:uncharacterized protein YidB (DUF937 family)